MTDFEKQIRAAKKAAWDECVRQVMLSAARGPVFTDDGKVHEIPANPYSDGWSDLGEVRRRHDVVIAGVRAAAWDEGWNAGYYFRGDDTLGDNPYREGGGL